MGQPTLYDDLQRICGIPCELTTEELQAEEAELIPCRHCDCIDFDIQDKTRDLWSVFCIDCGSHLGEVSDLEALLWIARIHHYERGWVYHQYLALNPCPNLEELREVEYVLGYRRGWAEHAYRELYEGAEVAWTPRVSIPLLRLGGASLFFREQKPEAQ
ncbi:hypothetical protein [Anthocerotibacter panamensis]|uniref:hypothetical protein n=1 Tax=Anthocerotibacter panamensis TaxID=2857077 RepID=UPI001C403500|nr:hypothetical protein [Anthocerotibacter panamensis]